MTAAETFFNAAAQTMGNLYGRWQDEREYEDIADYAMPLQRIAKQHNCAVESITARPFAIKFVAEGKRYEMKCGARSVSYRQIGVVAESGNVKQFGMGDAVVYSTEMVKIGGKVVKVVPAGCVVLLNGGTGRIKEEIISFAHLDHETV